MNELANRVGVSTKFESRNGWRARIKVMLTDPEGVEYTQPTLALDIDGPARFSEQDWERIFEEGKRLLQIATPIDVDATMPLHTV